MSDFNHFVLNDSEVINQKIKWQSYFITYEHIVYETEQKLKFAISGGIGAGFIMLYEYQERGVRLLCLKEILFHRW